MMKTLQELTTQMQLDAWNSHITRTNKLLDELSDEQLQNEIAPGKNTGVYLLGHLAAVHDLLSVMLGFGTQMNPDAEQIFIRNPDKSGMNKSTPAEIRNYWNEANARLATNFEKLEADEWLQRHTAVSEEDFQKEPHRNKLNVLISRTNHLAYHFGQMALLKK